MGSTDVVIITALEMEYEAAIEAGTRTAKRDFGVAEWTDSSTGTNPYLQGTYTTSTSSSMNIVLARPTRMGALAAAPLAATLVERLKPRCLAMCGVCAGNPSSVVLGDVIIANMAYAYDEGKVTASGFVGDHHQFLVPDSWVRIAQDMSPVGLLTHKEASVEDAREWLLDRLYDGDDPARHPARSRYFPPKTWRRRLGRFSREDLIELKDGNLILTPNGADRVKENRLLIVDGPLQMPFKIAVGPIASGSVVVKDGITWDKLIKWGVRSVHALEMEAASIGSVAYRSGLTDWVVVKGVMDYADPRKDDRFKHFAAKAAAEVLFQLLSKTIPTSATKDSSINRHRSATNVQGPSVDARNVLFEAYRPEVEPYYLQRDIERDVSEALSSAGLWLHGPSGSGKTCTIARFLALHARHKSISISLGSCLDGKLNTILCHILSDLVDFDKNASVHMTSKSSVPELVKLIRTAAAAIKVSGELYIYLDEIPINNATLFGQFIGAMAAIFSQPIGNTRLRLIVSSIISPRDFVLNSQKSFLGSIRILSLELWCIQELRSLLNILMSNLSIQLSDGQLDQVLERAKGSPRFIKKTLSCYLAHQGNSAWPLARVIAETERDL